MAKVTLNKDLVPYSRRLPANPKLNVCQDLTHNYLLACKLIRAVNVLFQMRKGTAVYSGYVYAREGGRFAIKLMHKDHLLRIVVLRNLGYAGVLHVELKSPKIGAAVGLDVLASLVDSTFHREPMGVE